MRAYRLPVSVLAVVLLFGLSAGCTPRELVKLENQNLELTEALDAAKQDLRVSVAGKKGLESQLAQKDQVVAKARADAKRWQEMYNAAEQARRTLSTQRVREIEELRESGVRVTQTIDGLRVEIGSDILFDPGKAALKPEGLATVKKVAAVLKGGQELYRIEGHTDNQPIKVSGWKDNWELSAARAHSVLASLEKNGVDPKRMYLAGFSFYKPVASNDTSAGRQRNRRVEILIVPRLVPKPMPAGTK